MSPVEIVAALEEFGIRVRVAHGEIDLDGAATPPAELLEELHRQGGAVLAFLRECGERPAPLRVVDRRKSDGESSGPAPRRTNELPLEEALEGFRDGPFHYGRPVASVQDLATGLMRPLGSTAAHAAPSVGFDLAAAMAPWGHERMAYYTRLCQEMLTHR